MEIICAVRHCPNYNIFSQAEHIIELCSVSRSVNMWHYTCYRFLWPVTGLFRNATLFNTGPHTMHAVIGRKYSLRET